MRSQPSTDSEIENYLLERERQWIGAAQARRDWAKQHGFANFAEMTKIGLQAAGRMNREPGK